MASTNEHDGDKVVEPEQWVHSVRGLADPTEDESAVDHDTADSGPVVPDTSE